MLLDELRARFEQAGHRVSPRDDVDAAAVSWFLEHSVGTLRNWRSQGKGPPYITLGCGVRYPLTGLVQWLAQQVRNLAA